MNMAFTLGAVQDGPDNQKSQMSMKQRLIVAFGLVLLSFVLGSTLLGWSLSRLVSSTRSLAEITLPHVVTVDDMNVQRVDVQQYFTDVAATRERRAYEGARQAAEGFLANVAKYRSAFERDGNVAGLERLARVESEFRRFDAAGRDMAETYLLQGTEAGNLKMQQFDAASL